MSTYESRPGTIGAMPGNLVPGAPAGPTTLTLVIADAEQSQSADSILLGQAHTLVVASAEQRQGAVAILLLQQHILAVADSEQAQGSDAFVLRQSQILRVDDAEQLQLLGQATLIQWLRLLPGKTSTRGILGRTSTFSPTSTRTTTVGKSGKTETDE